MLPFTGQAAGGISQFLGGDSSGFDAYKDAAGFDYASLLGSRGITGNRAASGLLRSSGTGEALADDYNQRTNLYAGNYLQQLGHLGQLGLGAGSLIAGTAPQTTVGSGGGSLGKLLGAGLAAFSDRRLKTDVAKVGEEPDGLGRYRFRYVWDETGTVRDGVMADEVAELRPWALGPVVGGYATVVYGAL